MVWGYPNIRQPNQMTLLKGRVLVWFSCGDASACAAKLAVEQYSAENIEVVYCNTFKYEHPDNVRFLSEIEEWLGLPIKILNPWEYTGYQDIYDVFDRSGYLVGPHGARCTTELKKRVRQMYAAPEDLHVFGFTADEESRIQKFEANNPELYLVWPLRDAGITKTDCHQMVRAAGIQLPAMYRMGYKNNNCIGCVKGGAGYWNKIRRDFPEAFERMAKQERKMGVHILKDYFLDELPESIGRYTSEPDIECGPVCGLETNTVPGEG